MTVRISSLVLILATACQVMLNLNWRRLRCRCLRERSRWKDAGRRRGCRRTEVQSLVAFESGGIVPVQLTVSRLGRRSTARSPCSYRVGCFDRAHPRQAVIVPVTVAI